MDERRPFKDFLDSLPLRFNDPAAARTAFVHRSYLNERSAKATDRAESNERLEFLGDAVLSSVISRLLFCAFPGVEEGELTRMRAKLVNKKTLAVLAKDLSLDEQLLLGKGEKSSGGADNPTTLACVFEALIGAAYIDGGYEAAEGFIEAVFGPLIGDELVEPGHFDFKPRLQQITQRHFGGAPEYRLVKDEGPAHKKLFEVEAVVAGEVLGRGCASNKKEAEQMAAAEALKCLAVRHKEFFER